MKCPDINSKTFEQSRKVLGTKIAYNSYIKNGNKPLELASNGNPSELFKSLVDITGSESMAIETKAMMLSDKFNNWFDKSIIVDNNGEPKILFYNTNEMNPAIRGKVLRGEGIGENIPVVVKSKEVIKEELDTNSIQLNRMFPHLNISKKTGNVVSGTDGLVVFNDKNIMPLFKMEEYDSIKKSMVKPIMVFRGNNSNRIAVNGKAFSYDNFPSMSSVEGLLTDNIYSNEPSPEMVDKILNSYNHKLGNMLVDTLGLMFPQIKFIKESKASTLSKTGSMNKDGWVDEAGRVHVNMESINPETPLHELGHILEPILAQKYPNQYNSIMKSITTQIEANDGYYSILYEEADNNKYLTTHSQKMSEVFAEGLATTTLKYLNTILNIAGDTTLNPEEQFNIVKADFSEIREDSTLLFDDIVKGTKINSMEDFGFLLANNIALQRTIMLSEENLDHLETFYRDNGVKYRQTASAETKASISINNTSDITKVLRGKYQSKTDLLANASNMAARLIRNRNEGDDIFVKQEPRNLIYKPTITHTDLTARLYEDYFLPKAKLNREVPDNIIKNFNPKNRKNSDLYKLLGNKTSEQSIDHLRLILGLDEAVDHIMKYSDLQNSDNPDLRSIYSKDFSGEDTIIIVHSINKKDGHIQLSVVDMSPNRLGENMSHRGQRNIFSEYMTDDEYYNKVNSNEGNHLLKLRNTDADVRQLNVSLLVSHIHNKLGDKVSFNKMGVAHITTSRTYGRMIVDIEGMMQNLEIMNDMLELKKNLTSEDLKRAIINGKNIKASNFVSYTGLLKSYLINVASGNIKDNNLNFAANDLIKRLNNGDVEAQLKVLESMKSFLKSKLKNQSDITDSTYMLVVKASRELRTGKVGTINDLKDISEWSAKLTTMYHMRNDYVQDVITATKEASFKIVDKSIKDIKKLAGTTKNPGLGRQVLKNYFDKNISKNLESLVIDVGSDIFGHLYKKKTINVVNSSGVKTGEKVDAKMPEIHWDKNDTETKKALNEGLINETDLAFTNEMLDILEERLIDYFYHTNTQRNKEFDLKKESQYTREDAREEYKKHFPNKGMLPMIEKSTAELLRSSSFKKGISKGFKQFKYSEALFEDVLNFDEKKDDALKEMGFYFSEQLTEDDRLAAAGIKINENGEMVIEDPTKNQDISTDIWKTFNYLNQAIIRKIEYESNVFPVAIDSLALLHQLGEASTSEDNTQKNNIKVIKEFIDRTAYRKNQDKPNPSKIGKYDVDVAPITRALKTGMNKAVLSFKLSLGITSLGFNLSKIMIENLTSVVEKSEGQMPSFKNFMKAAKESFTVDGFNKMRAMALDYHIWGRTERELFTDPFINISDRSLLNSMITNVFNWATDTWARSLVMTATMMQDGSWEAHHYDKKSGTIKYNENEDLRWYNEDGTKKTDSKTLALYEGVKEDIIKTYNIEGELKSLPTGYGMTDAIYMKQLADTKIIGAFDDESSALITNRWMGNAMMQYRNYTTVRLFNMGMFANEFKTDVGQRIVAVKDENGKWISQRQIQDLEGALQSFGKLVLNGDGFNLKENYDNLSVNGKRNIVKTLIQSAMAMMMFGLLMKYDDDDKYDKTNPAYYVNRFASDMFAITAITDIVKNPLPLVNAIKRMFDKGEFWKMLPYSSAAEEFYLFSGRNKD